MSQITEGLTTRIGPAPAWVYGVGLGAVIIGVRAYRARKSTPVAPAPASDGASTGATGANPSPAGGPSTPPAVGGYVIPTNYQTPANPGGIIDYNGNTTTGASANNAPTNVDDWSNQAYSHLLAHGYASTAATEALRKFLAGEPVTASEEGMIGVALREVGPVPGGAPALTRATTTTGATVPNTAPSSVPTPTPTPTVQTPTPTPAAAAPAGIFNNPAYTDAKAAQLWAMLQASAAGHGTDQQRADAYRAWATEIGRLRSVNEYDDRYSIPHGPPYAPGERGAGY